MPKSAGFSTSQWIRLALSSELSSWASIFRISAAVSILNTALSSISTSITPSTPRGYATAYADARREDALLTSDAGIPAMESERVC